MDNSELCTLEKGIQAFEQGDYVLAFAFLSVLAEKGNPQAQSYLGCMYQGGLGFPANGEQAVIWYMKAAEQEITAGLVSAIAYNNLATIYTTGMLGVVADKKLAGIYLEKARKLGFPI